MRGVKIYEYYFFLFASCRAKKKPVENNNVISPAKYGIKSIIPFVI